MRMGMSGAHQKVGHATRSCAPTGLGEECRFFDSDRAATMRACGADAPPRNRLLTRKETTMATNDHVIDTVNDLIENAKDGQYGFAKCAERVESPQLRQTLLERSDECGRAVAELQDLVARYGGKPAEHGTVLGALHRGWVSVKDTLTGNSDHAVLEECERGEDAALARYRKAMDDDLPQDARDVIARQMAGAQANHDQVKLLRDTTAA
jgi:uncharacterized protein (TIGR02284 family)